MIESKKVTAWFVTIEGGVSFVEIWERFATVDLVRKSVKAAFPNANFAIQRIDTGVFKVSKVCKFHSVEKKRVNSSGSVVVWPQRGLPEGPEDFEMEDRFQGYEVTEG